MKAVNIKWNTDGQKTVLPEEIDIPEGIMDEDEISDYISNVTGYCHFGFDIAEVNNEEDNLKNYLIEHGVWEREVPEVLGNFNKNATEDDMVISAIFDSAYDLGSHYIDNVVGTLDRHIEAVLDYSELGKHIAECDDEYLILDSGRIFEFDI